MMKNKIIALLLTILTIPAFAQTKVAQKQIANLQDSLNIRQRYADTNTTDATRNWVQSQNYEVTTNKVTNFNSANNTKYPTTQAVKSIPLDSILTWNSKNLSPSNFIRINNNADDRFIRLYSNGLGLYTNTLGTGSIMYYSQLIRGTDSFVFSRNGYFANNNQMIYGFIGGTGYNQQHIMRYDTSKVWFGSTASTTSPAANTATYRYSAMSGNDGSVQIDNLAGTGNRMVIASSTGLLSTQAIPVETDPIYTSAEPTILRYRSAITSSSNLNSFTSTGIYSGTSAVTATLSNCPFPSGEIQLSVTTSGNYVRQMITNVGSTFTNQIYTRTSVNGGTNWSSWQRLILGGDSVSLLTNDAGYITQNIANANLPIAGGTNRTLTIGPGSTFSIVGNSMIKMSGGGGNPALELIAPNDAVFISGDNPDSFGVSMRTTNLTTNRDADWQDTSGTVAFLHDIHPTALVKVDDDYTVKPEELTVVCFGATTFQLNLPDPAAFTNRNLIISMQMAIASGEQVNLSEDVYFYDRSDGTTPISINSIPASEYGKYYRLQSDGTVWWLINPEP